MWVEFNQSAARQLCAHFAVGDCPRADISWLKLEWLQSPTKGTDRNQESNCAKLPFGAALLANEDEQLATTADAPLSTTNVFF